MGINDALIKVKYKNILTSFSLKKTFIYNVEVNGWYKSIPMSTIMINVNNKW